MLKIHSQRNIRFMTVEQPTVWVVVAFLVETTGTETKVVSAPRIIKILPKKCCGLLPGTRTDRLALPAPVSRRTDLEYPVISPYVSAIFGYTNSDVIIGLAARPPTFA